MTTVIDIRTGKAVTDLAERSRAQSESGTVATRLAVGCTADKGTLRTHRFSDYLVLWDLTNAGRPGKKVAKLSVSPSYTMTAAERDDVMERVAGILEGLASYGVAAAILMSLAFSTKNKLLDLHLTEARGVDVAPAGFTAITIQTEILDLTASYSDFSIHCLTDKHNRPTACQPAKHERKVVRQFYAWVSANQERIKGMSYREVLSAMDEQGIRYHGFCGM